MRKALTTTLTLTTVLGIGIGLGPVAATAGGDRSPRGDERSENDALDVVGLAGGTTLVTFSTKKPSRAGQSVTVTGLGNGDTALVGIDYRVQDGKLYGLGNDKATAGIYALDPSTGAAVLLRELTLPLTGKTFGVDFNPAANALRIIGNDGQNVRQPLATPGALTVNDGVLTYTAPTFAPAAAATPATATAVTAAAYTNNDLDGTPANGVVPNRNASTATATTLFDIDTFNDQVVVQSPANSGVLVTTGRLGVDFGLDSGFDIYSTVRNGSTVENVAYAVSNGTLYEIDVLTGKAESEGAVPTGVTDIAIPLDQL